MNNKTQQEENNKKKLKLVRNLLELYSNAVFKCLAFDMYAHLYILPKMSKVKKGYSQL